MSTIVSRTGLAHTAAAFDLWDCRRPLPYLVDIVDLGDAFDGLPLWDDDRLVHCFSLSWSHVVDSVSRCPHGSGLNVFSSNWEEP